MSSAEQPPAATTHRPRHFRDDTKEPRSRDAFKQLMASLKRLVNDYPPESVEPGGGLYYGPGEHNIIGFVNTFTNLYQK
jgi:hypothetical protein